MYFETFISTILFKKSKLNTKKKKKKATQVFQILGRSEKGKQNIFFLGLMEIVYCKTCLIQLIKLLYL